MYQPPYDPNGEYNAGEPAYTVDGVPVETYDEDPAYQPPAPRDPDFRPARRFSIFKPRLGKPNFILSVLVNAVRFLLLVGATLGGNLTPIGASANIAGLGILRKEGHEVSAGTFMKMSVPFTLAAVTTGYLLVWFIWR